MKKTQSIPLPTRWMSSACACYGANGGRLNKKWRALIYCLPAGNSGLRVVQGEMQEYNVLRSLPVTGRRGIL
jgi:hypothetical protein